MLLIVFFTKEDSLESYSGNTMGTYYKVIVTSSDDTNKSSLIKDTLELVNQEMSTYLETSFISKLNATPVGYWIDSTSSFLQVMNMAIEICDLSEGYFDVSAGSLVNIWGFGPSEILKSPDQTTVLNSLKEIGCDSISIDTLNNRVRRERNVQIDFSAIAKGFAIDQVYNELKKNIYITGFFIEVGGEIKTYGLKGKNTPWSVGIAHPEYTSKPIFESKTNTRESFSMATSGDYRNIRILDDKVLSHTINTKNGSPLEVLNSSVSVVNGSAMRADALATAINAMGPTKGLTFANNKNIDAIFILKEEENYVVKFSESFKKTLQ